MFSKQLLQASVQELYSCMVSTAEEGELKEVRDEKNNIIVHYSTLRNVLKYQLKKMSEHYKFVCSC